MPTNALGIATDAMDRILKMGSDGIARIHGSDGGLVDDAFAVGLQPTNSLAFGEGDLWGTGLYTVSDGELLRFDMLGNPTIMGTGFAENVSDIAFGPDGGLYVSIHAEDRILRILPGLGALSLLAVGGLADTEGSEGPPQPHGSKADFTMRSGGTASRCITVWGSPWAQRVAVRWFGLNCIQRFGVPPPLLQRG